MKQITTCFLVILAAGMILFSGNDIRAKEHLELSSGSSGGSSWDEAVANENRVKKYLWFSPRAQSWDEVVSILKTANAVYKTTISCQKALI